MVDLWNGIRLAITQHRVAHRGARKVSHESVDVSLDAFQIIGRYAVMNPGFKKRNKAMGRSRVIVSCLM
ncbi:MAG: hypothetical protein Q9167_004570 [Letrouitia subvulpina]